MNSNSVANLRVTHFENGYFHTRVDLSIECDMNGIFTFSSPDFREMLGYAVSDLSGRPVFEYVHPDDVHAALIAFDVSMKTGSPCKAKFRYRKSSGEYIWLESNCSATINKNLTVTFQVVALKKGEKPCVTFPKYMSG